MTSADENMPPSPVLARQLVRGLASAALSTVSGDGQPHGSLVISACDLAARPVLLISSLAVHTQNLSAEPRVALLYEDCRDLASPLTGPRLTVSGELKRAKDEDEDKILRARFLRRHPDAVIYADFADFDLFRLAVTSVHLVAGFGRIETIAADDFVFEAPCNAELGRQEAEIVAHMNADHADAVDLLARAFAGADTTGWTMTGIDAEGFDLRQAGKVARINFAGPLVRASDARESLVSLVSSVRDQS